MKHLFILVLSILFPVFVFSGNVLVTNNNDSGEGSLRNAIETAESGDTISIACGLTAIDLQSGTLVINNKSLTILGCVTVISRKGYDNFRILEIIGTEEITVEFHEVCFSNGKTETVDENGVLSGEFGAGIYVDNPSATLILRDCDIFDNETGYGDRAGNGGSGAGIFLNGGILELHSCNIYGNKTGNGFSEEKSKCNDGGDGGHGSGIAVENGNLYIYNSTINNNITGSGLQNTCESGIKGSGYGGSGAGIWLKESTAYFENVTFYENTTGGSDSTYSGFGGAIYSGTNSEVQITNCTFTKNSTGISGIETFSRGGAIFNEPMSIMIMKNSIVSGNFLGNSSSEEATDIFGEITSNGNNIIGKIEGCTGITNGENNDLAGNISEPLDAGLLPLAMNGSLTKTCALRPESPAVDSGDLIEAPTNDQRDYPRINAVDIGAFEFGISPIITSIFAISPDGQYFAGDQISLGVVFSEPVWIVGSFEIRLETGTIDRIATYYGGSGNDTIQFSYNVRSGDISSDLDVKSSLSFLICHNCLIYDFDNYNAVLILPEPGSENSLSSNSNIIIGNPNTINLPNNDLINIYPNPVTNILNIKIPNLKSNNQIRIYNSIGKLISDKNNLKSNHFSFDMSNYPAGIYFAKITNGEIIKTYKFIIQ